MQINWEQEIARLLTKLSDIQRELLTLLAEKRALLAKADAAGLAALHSREEAMVERLQACQQERTELLAKAAHVGLPHSSLKSLVSALPQRGGMQFKRNIDEASQRARLLQHQSLTNWMVAQRTLLHLSQLIEIIATGGRLQPTYGKGEPVATGGSLVDQAA